MIRPELLEVPIQDLADSLAASVDHAVIMVRKEEHGQRTLYAQITGDPHIAAGLAADALVRAGLYLYALSKNAQETQSQET